VKLFTDQASTNIEPGFFIFRAPSPMHPRSLPPHDPIANALTEDIGQGDLSATYFADASPATARLFTKQPCVIAGTNTAAEVFRRVCPNPNIRLLSPDGTHAPANTTILTVEAPANTLLSAERTALNFLQRLSGIATLTHQYVQAIAHTQARILDTRKTTPGLRLLEKQAVLAGGGSNHRIGLYDMVMVKDNHLAADSFDQLRERILRFKSDHPTTRIELEADTLEQVERFLTLPHIDVILLDNMTLDQLRQAVRLNQGKLQLEASGGVNLQSVAAIAETGVDLISVGALTHSAPSVDISMEINP
jgi:nicotinate-nucleotide pyrophosphorylase (carboxylating)